MNLRSIAFVCIILIFQTLTQQIVNARYRPSSLTFNDLQRRSDNSVLENQAKQLVRDILSNVDDILDDWKQNEPVDESANWLKQILENARYNKRRYRPGNL